jgi:hypothetical protein
MLDWLAALVAAFLSQAMPCEPQTPVYTPRREREAGMIQKQDHGGVHGTPV